MTHPPTQCDRSLFLDKNAKPLVITETDIRKSIAWYEQAWTSINEALPVSVEGTVYTDKWQKRFDYQTLPAWREGRLRLNLAVAYVYLALRRLFRGLRERASP